MKFEVVLRRTVDVKVSVEAESPEAAREHLAKDCNDLDYFHAGQIDLDVIQIKSIKRAKQ